MKRKGIPDIRNTFVRRVLCFFVALLWPFLIMGGSAVELLQEVKRAICNMSFSKGSKWIDGVNAVKNCWNGNYDL